MPLAKNIDINKSRKAKLSNSENSWRSEIEDLSLNDERWSCVIGMIVETRLDHTRYLDLFTEAADEEKRESIFSLSYEKLIRGTRLLGKSNLNLGICNFASRKIEDEGEGALDPWLISRLIKFFINRAKTKNLEIMQSRARIEKEITKEIETLGTTRPETTAKSKGGSGDARSFDKVNTRLRKRGEEWRDRIPIDDAPIEGSNLYVVLTGFRDVNLVTELLRAGLPLTAIFKVLRPGEELDADQSQLYSFWSTLEETLTDTKSASIYSQVVFQTFCPPKIEEIELETLKRDAYQRISFLMYDLYDIKRHHFNYIEKMSLQSGLEEKRPEIQNTEKYDKIMNVFPEECTSVPIVLDALLSHIDDLETLEETFDEEEKTLETLKGRLRLKIEKLNNEFDIFDIGRVEIPPGALDPRFILHGDSSGRKTHHCSLKICPADFESRVLKEHGISLIWKNVPALTNEQKKMYEYHIGQISKCFESSVDVLNRSHYLHILLFDKLINGEKPRKNLLEREDLERKISFLTLEERPLKLNVKCTMSAMTPHDKSLAESLPIALGSDGVIDYRKEISETFECPELLSLIDTREILESFPKILELREFNTVQLLSADVFCQAFFTCFQEFDSFETRYCAPTDSMLIFFHNNRRNEKIVEKEYTASIRTPVCLRDFSSFVMSEEKEWLEKEDEEHRKKLAEKATLREAQVQKNTDNLPLVSVYTDADFILPNSLKGKQVRKQRSLQALVDAEQTETKKKSKKGKEINPRKDKIPKKKSRVINPINKKKESLETNVSFFSLEKTPLEDTEPIFLGYNIADHRIQVSGFTSEFLSDDGTVVKVNVEEWIYGERRLRIIVKLCNNELIVHSISNEDSATFNFRPANGILMGFSLPFDKKNERVSTESAPIPETVLNPGFKVSWPSGLLVETLPGDSPSEPFYIKQSYLSKGPECNEISRETKRVFLHDGTILVFLNDDSVRLMCSNGRIVTCNGFANRDEEKGENSLPAGKPKNRQNSKGSIETITKKRRTLNSSVGNDDILIPKNGSKNLRTLKIDRCVVLEPNGRLYEIINDEKTREIGQELVRTASDYEFGERFIRRSDGTDILMNSDGVMIVCFPDGSRITTGFVIEEIPVFCEWTEKEFQQFDHSANNGEPKSRENILNEDGFVSIFLTHCMEHKNYATVIYDQSKINCNLLMPGDVRVCVSSDDSFSVTIGTGTSLKVEKNVISLTERIGTSFTSSVFNLGKYSSSSITEKPFLETIDSLDNVFSVDINGKTTYKKFCEESDFTEQTKEHCSSSSRLSTKQNNQFLSHSKSYRLFAVNRDLSAHEFLHNSERIIQESDETASTFFHQINDEPEQTLCTTLITLNPNTESQAWLQPYRVKTVRPMNEDRKDLLRSTYSIPWNYLIPYGKNGQGIWKRSWNLPLKINHDCSRPDVLLARTTEIIKNQEDNVLKKLQDAMSRYWNTAINNFVGYRNNRISQEFTSHGKSEIENWLNDFSLGRRKTFDRTLYFDGLLKKSSVTQKLESQISRKKDSRSENKTEKDEIEWYQNCLRDRTVPPYFTYITGACFTWVLECVEKKHTRNEQE